MHRLTAERPVPLTEGGAPTGHQSAKDIGVRDCTIATPFSTVTPRAVASRNRGDGIGAARGLALAILFDLVLVAAIFGAWHLVSFMANHLPDLMLGACIVVLGILFGAMLAVKS